MSGCICKPDNKKPANDHGKESPPAPSPDDDEEDGDIATPKRNRDDEAE